MKFLEEEQERIEEAQSRLYSLDEELLAGSLTEVQALECRQILEREVFKTQSFDRVWAQYEYLQNTPEAQFVYEDGYNILFNVKNEMVRDMFPLICIMLILCCHTLFPTEYSSGISGLLFSTTLGRRHLTKIKLRISIVFMLIIAVGGVLPDFILVGSTIFISCAVCACYKPGSVFRLPFMASHLAFSLSKYTAKAFSLRYGYTFNLSNFQGFEKQYLYTACLCSFNSASCNFLHNWT